MRFEFEEWIREKMNSKEDWTCSNCNYVLSGTDCKLVANPLTSVECPRCGGAFLENYYPLGMRESPQGNGVFGDEEPI